jgi:hypothetical protein
VDVFYLNFMQMFNLLEYFLDDFALLFQPLSWCGASSIDLALAWLADLRVFKKLGGLKNYCFTFNPSTP